jgi:hypothetical protein
VNGVFTNGALVYERSDDSGARKLLTTTIANHFDGPGADIITGCDRRATSPG